MVQGSNLRPSPCKGDALPTELTTLGKVAERTGLEPATPGVTGRYSNQLNYRSAYLSLVGGAGFEPATLAL